MTITAAVVLDSISEHGHRLTTFKLRYPRFIHDELLTHRVFSRNASSSRAVPVAKRIADVRADVAMPVFWGKNQPGMQAVEECNNLIPSNVRTEHNGDVSVMTVSYMTREHAWDQEALAACDRAEAWAKAGYHKQLVNRLLMPFEHITVVVTATEFMNFFGLRLDAGAQPEMRAVAEAMWLSYQASTATLLRPGDWHLPFIEQPHDRGPVHGDLDLVAHHVKVSVARCARTSYLSLATGELSTVEEDLILFNKLMVRQPVHASPAEHQATPDRYIASPYWEHPDQHGNLTGWRQYRKMIPGEAIAELPEGYRS